MLYSNVGQIKHLTRGKSLIVQILYQRGVFFLLTKGCGKLHLYIYTYICHHNLPNQQTSLRSFLLFICLFVLKSTQINNATTTFINISSLTYLMRHNIIYGKLNC